MAFSSSWTCTRKSKISLAKSRPATKSRRFLLEEAAPMLRKLTSAFFLIVFTSVLTTAANAGTPDWLRSAAQQPPKTYADDANAVVLLDDQETTVKDSGEIVTHERIAYRILRPEGKSYAAHSVYFDSETKLNSFHGWSITAKGLEYEA